MVALTVLFPIEIELATKDVAGRILEGLTGRDQRWGASTGQRSHRACAAAWRADHRAERCAAGLDAVAAAAEGKINSVRMISRKPVKALLGAAHLEAKGIDLSNIREPKQVFSGTAAEAAVGFPENLQCCCGAWSCGHRRRTNNDRSVGRSEAHAQHASH